MPTWSLVEILCPPIEAGSAHHFPAIVCCCGFYQGGRVRPWTESRRGLRQDRGGVRLEPAMQPPPQHHHQQWGEKGGSSSLGPEVGSGGERARLQPSEMGCLVCRGQREKMGHQGPSKGPFRSTRERKSCLKPQPGLRAPCIPSRAASCLSFLPL